MKTKNFRRRADDDGEGDDAAPVKSQQPPKSSLSKKEKAKEKGAGKPSGPKLLSFAEDEDSIDGGDLIKSVSRKDKPSKTPVTSERDELLAGDLYLSSSKAKKKVPGFGALQGSAIKLSAGKEKSAALPSNFQPQAGEYTKEKLMELQKNTIRLGGAKPPTESKPSEPVLVLKGLLKPSLSFGSGVMEVETLADTEIMGVTQHLDGKFGDIRAGEARDLAKLETDDAESRLGLMGIGAGAEGGGVTHIPDAAAIAAAKAKRERLRQAQAIPDYIPLGNMDSVDLRGKPRETATQDKEDDLSSDDEGEIQARIAMLGEKPSEKTKGGVFESVEEKIENRVSAGQRDDDEEDEECRWEEEQLRKGFGKRVDDAANRAGPTALVPHQEALHPKVYFSSGLAIAPLPSSGWGFNGQSMEAMTVSQKAEAAMSTLQDTLHRIRETYSWTKSELNRTEENLSASLLNISTLEKSLAMAGEKYVYMQRLRDYIAVLCDFLKSKGPLIEELEEHMQRLHEERATAVSERRSADNADEMLEVESAINAAMSALSKGASTSAAAAAAATAASSAQSARDGSNMATQLDEFGRDLNLQKRMEVKQRAQAREHRRARAAKKRAASFVSNQGEAFGGTQIEGESSSDESESEENAFKSGCAEILETADRVFGDAAEEFSQLALVKEKLESWKRMYSTAYRDAYVSLSAPALFAPFVRLELLKWDPLYGDGDFNNMMWHTLLFDYGMPENGTDVSSEDVDMDLVPKLVEKVALPVLHHEVAHCWDILSSRSTKNAVAAVQVVLNYVPTSSDALQDLLSAVRSQLSEAVAEVEVPTWSHQVMNIVPQAARIAAYRFGTSVRLLKNVALWKDVLAMPLLEKLALDDLLCGKMLPHLRNLLHSPYDAISRTERVVTALSGVWIGPNFTSRPKLEPLVDFLMSIGRTIEKRKGASAEDVVGLARRLKRMLVELNEYDRARWLSKNFQLKEAL